MFSILRLLSPLLAHTYYGPELGQLLVVDWLIQLIPLSLAGVMAWFFGRGRVKWNRWDYSLAVVPYLAWCAGSIFVVPHSVGGLMRGSLIVGCIVCLAPILRVVVAGKLNQEFLAFALLVVTCGITAMATFLPPQALDWTGWLPFVVFERLSVLVWPIGFVVMAWGVVLIVRAILIAPRLQAENNKRETTTVNRDHRRNIVTLTSDAARLFQKLVTERKFPPGTALRVVVQPDGHAGINVECDLPSDDDRDWVGESSGVVVLVAKAIADQLTGLTIDVRDGQYAFNMQTSNPSIIASSPRWSN